MPPPKKPADQRQRRNKPAELDRQVIQLNTAVAPPPPKVSAALKRDWATLWQSEIAATWNVESDLPAMRRLFELYDRVAKYEREAAKDGIVSRGSTGQKAVHPLLKQADTLRSQILALEDRFGLSPMARLKLGIALGEADRSLDEMNRRLAGDDGGGDVDEDEDPRLIIDVESA
jgi:P27 family predicted phage terminase small subunit